MAKFRKPESVRSRRSLRAAIKAGAKFKLMCTKRPTVAAAMKATLSPGKLRLILAPRASRPRLNVKSPFSRPSSHSKCPACWCRTLHSPSPLNKAPQRRTSTCSKCSNSTLRCLAKCRTKQATICNKQTKRIRTHTSSSNSCHSSCTT